MHKTTQMMFQKGGRETHKDSICYKNKPVQTVTSFKYLGMTLQTTTKSFRNHMKTRATTATKAIFDIKILTRLTLKTIMTLFEAKILPILMYGIDIILVKLSIKDLQNMKAVGTLPKVRPRHLHIHPFKISLQIIKRNCPNRRP